MDTQIELISIMLFLHGIKKNWNLEESCPKIIKITQERPLPERYHYTEGNCKQKFTFNGFKSTFRQIAFLMKNK